MAALSHLDPDMIAACTLLAVEEVVLPTQTTNPCAYQRGTDYTRAPFIISQKEKLLWKVKILGWKGCITASLSGFGQPISRSPQETINHAQSTICYVNFLLQNQGRAVPSCAATTIQTRAQAELHAPQSVQLICAFLLSSKQVCKQSCTAVSAVELRFPGVMETKMQAVPHRSRCSGTALSLCHPRRRST